MYHYGVAVDANGNVYVADSGNSRIQVFTSTGTYLAQWISVVPWGVAEFGEKGVDYEIYSYLEHTPSPDARDRDLLDRVKFFIADPDVDKLALDSTAPLTA